MKRKNPFMLGTILVVMIGGLVVAQSRLAPPEADPHDDHGNEGGDQAPQPPEGRTRQSPPTGAPTGMGTNDAPDSRVLADQVKGGTEGAGATAEPPDVPPNEKMNEDEGGQSYPSSQWYKKPGK